MQLPNLQFIKSIPVWGPRLYEAFNAVQQQTTRIEKQGNLNAVGDPPVPPPPDELKVSNGPSGEYQIAITHNGEFNRGTVFHVQWDTSPHFTNPHNIDLGASRNDSSLYLPGQTAYFRSSAASPSGANSTWTYHGSQNAPLPVIGGVRGVRAPGMGSGTGAPGDQGGGPGPIQARNSASGYNWKAQQRTAGAGFGASAQGSPAGVGAASGSGGGGGGGGATLTEAAIASCEWLTSVAGTNAITATTTTSYQAIAAGFLARFIPANSNSAAVTLNVNSTGAKAVTKNGTTALSGGELQAGEGYLLEYDGTGWQIIGLTASMISGDATVASTGVLTLATVNGNVGTFGDSTHTLTVTVNAKGLITSISVNAITFPAPTMAQIISALGYTPATSGAHSSFALTAPVGGGAVTGTITQV